MLRAGTKGPNPLIIAGLHEENIVRLKNGQPIAAKLADFSPGLDGKLVIFYGKTNADLEGQMAEFIGDKTQRSSDPQMERQEAARKQHDKILICTVGLPRSGKTFWARSQAWPIVCPDAIRLALHGHRFIAEAEGHVRAIAKTMVRALFLAGHQTVILDATNGTKKRRVEWFDDAWTTFFKVIPTTKEDCLFRASLQQDHEIIPVIERMAAQFEPLDETCNLW